MLVVFAISLFAGAALLFLVEPMIAKMLLPIRLPTGAAAWRSVQRRPGTAVWTDDYSNLLSVMKWDGFVNGLGASAR